MTKPEPKSAAFTSLLKTVVLDADDNTPIRKVLQKLIMTTISDNDHDI